MELTEAIVNEAHEEIIEITLTGDEDEWREIAQVLKESDSDLATELGLKIKKLFEMPVDRGSYLTELPI